MLQMMNDTITSQEMVFVIKNQTYIQATEKKESGLTKTVKHTGKKNPKMRNTQQYNLVT